MPRHSLPLAALIAASLLAGGALADPPSRESYRDTQRETYRDAHRDSSRDARHERRDYRPIRGTVVPRLGPDRRVVRYRDANYYFSSGTWYRPMGSRFVIVAPPISAVIPILPSGYVTLSIGGRPYYRYNDVYYVRDDRGYVVVEPPREVAGTEPPAPPDDLFVYPKMGQTEQQQATDRYECHEWASSQTGYDPTRVSGGVPPEQADALRGGYLRAMSACLEARNYTVR